MYGVPKRVKTVLRSSKQVRRRPVPAADTPSGPKLPRRPRHLRRHRRRRHRPASREDGVRRATRRNQGSNSLASGAAACESLGAVAPHGTSGKLYY
ncbi:hypothetical protein R5R35_000547 [Gryllus longicercus]|uniref:Uncharacterized protein n=1 Tax=Gryllus longicercus TaxID=2509291 RepID=A0AAN9WCL2_9ORTH